jgi:hypothetical protein
MMSKPGAMRMKRFGLVFAGILVVFVLFFFLFRNILLKAMVKRAGERLKNKYGFTLSLKEARFRGISTVSFVEVLVKTSEGDSLFHCAETEADIKTLFLFLGKVRLNKLKVLDMSLQLNRRHGHDPLRQLLFKDQQNKKKIDKKTETDWGELSNRLLNKVFSSLPAETQFINTHFSYSNDTASTKWYIPQLTFQERRLRASLTVSEEENTNTWFAGALIDPSTRSVSLMVYPGKSGRKNLPFLKTFFNLETGFDTLRLSLYPLAYDNGELQISGDASIKNLRAHHWRIAPEDVRVEKASLFFVARLGSRTLSIDSLSRFAVNRLEFSPYFSYSSDGHWKTEGGIRMKKLNCKDFFSSLPEGLFSGFKGFKAKGNLAYSLDFSIDESRLDSLRFNSSLTAEQFRVESYGQTNFAKINDVFTHTVYEKGQAVASFEVGPGNPDYTPLDQISGYLQNAVLCSEDGDFYYHNGFNEKAFRKSIATNIREKKFKRGGSTISMQLVKNVFLTRNKTISRKLEEALVVWLIENRRLCSKERMLEVYLNIIEWGPGVYGISQAARYYFNKKPADLGLSESIYLAMIVPRPKWFYWNFDEAGRLKPYTADYFRLIAGHLMRREIITEDEKNNLIPEVELRGKAYEKLKIASPDSLPALMDTEEGMADEN